MKQEVEFRIVNDEELPPVVISAKEDGSPKVVLNTYHKLWISLNRKLIAGIIVDLPNKLDKILDAFLKEQYEFEMQDRLYMED